MSDIQYCASRNFVSDLQNCWVEGTPRFNNVKVCQPQVMAEMGFRVSNSIIADYNRRSISSKNVGFLPECSEIIFSEGLSELNLSAGKSCCGVVDNIKNVVNPDGSVTMFGSFTLEGDRAPIVAELLQDKNVQLYFVPRLLVKKKEDGYNVISITGFTVTSRIIKVKI